MGAGVALAAFALAGAVQPSAGASAPVEPTVMVVELPRGAPYLGLPRRCPGEPEDTPDEEQICFAELYQGRADVLRHLSGPRVPSNMVLRFTAHARRWPPGMSLLVATVPFEDRGVRGQFAYWVDTPEPDDEFCASSEELAAWEGGPIRRAYMTGHRRWMRPYGFTEALAFRCLEPAD